MWQRTKIAVLLIWGLFSALPLVAQLRFSVWSDNYFEVTSYLGKTTPDRFNVFQFDLNGLNVNEKNWSLAVRLLAPIRTIAGGKNRSGNTFPVDKISLRWTGDNNEANFRLDGIGASRTPIILQNSNDVLLINRAKQPISSNGNYYQQYQLYSALTVAQGKYLDDYLSPDQYTYLKYRVPLLFTLYSESGKVLGTQEINYEMQLPPRLSDGGMVDMEPDYSLEIAADAANATLQFSTQKDYMQGVSSLVANAIRVNSITDYELRVKSVDSELVRNGGGTLPLSTLSLQLTAGTGINRIRSNPKVFLTTQEQVAVSAASVDKKQAQTFNVEYKANLTADQVSASKSGSYSVSLFYLLIPQ
ncbi:MULTISPECIES: hypothetical protein [Sphingobacterium]|uniref:hypothetical protein n=1 Tax=Sphingobacterium TaxID=28453 RepID=UPI000EC8E925|nr:MULTISPECIES: hypothetical protein [Sphingobacterium]HAL51680.1 hypothetical protein [Sphingobacterium sp.]